MIRTRICFYILLLTPLLVYWQAVFHDYGFRDDYSYLRESREEQGQMVRHTASHGRPLYGALLETSFNVAESVNGLPWLRLTSVLLLTLLGLALWRQLYQSGWNEIEAAAIGLGMTLLPAAQVTAAWAIGWPYALTLLLALAGFSAIETELERGGLKRVIALVGGGLIYMLAGLVYQSDALFAVVPITAVLIVRSGRQPMNDMRWCAVHLSLLLAGLLAAYFLVLVMFHAGVFEASPRMLFDTNPFSKLAWFLWQPLPNSLALYVLRDNFHSGEVFFWAAVLLVGGLIGYAFSVDKRRSELPAEVPTGEIGVSYKVKAFRVGPLPRNKWLVCLAVMPFVAHAVSLAAAERSTAYRVLFPLSGLVVLMVVFSIRTLLDAGKIKQVVHHTALGLICLAAAIMAHRNAFALLAQPQGREWDLVRSAVMRADFKSQTKAYIITPSPADRSTDRFFGDEFGSLSSDSEWVPQEMFKEALHERFAGKLPKGSSYTVTVGRAVPDEKAYDLVIDMRKLREYRGK